VALESTMGQPIKVDIRVCWRVHRKVCMYMHWDLSKLTGCGSAMVLR